MQHAHRENPHGNVLMQYLYRFTYVRVGILTVLCRICTFEWVCSCTVCPERSTGSCRSTESARAPRPPLPLLSSYAHMLWRPHSSALILSKQTWPTQNQAHSCAHMLSHIHSSCARMLSHPHSSALAPSKQTWPTQKQQRSSAHVLFLFISTDPLGAVMT